MSQYVTLPLPVFLTPLYSTPEWFTQPIPLRYETLGKDIGDIGGGAGGSVKVEENGELDLKPGDWYQSPLTGMKMAVSETRRWRSDTPNMSNPAKSQMDIEPGIILETQAVWIAAAGLKDRNEIEQIVCAYGTASLKSMVWIFTAKIGHPLIYSAQMECPTYQDKALLVIDGYAFVSAASERLPKYLVLNLDNFNTANVHPFMQGVINKEQVARQFCRLSSTPFHYGGKASQYPNMSPEFYALTRTHVVYFNVLFPDLLIQLPESMLEADHNNRTARSALRCRVQAVRPVLVEELRRTNLGVKTKDEFCFTSGGYHRGKSINDLRIQDAIGKEKVDISALGGAVADMINHQHSPALTLQESNKDEPLFTIPGVTGEGKQRGTMHSNMPNTQNVPKSREEAYAHIIRNPEALYPAGNFTPLPTDRPGNTAEWTVAADFKHLRKGEVVYVEKADGKPSGYDIIYDIRLPKQEGDDCQIQVFRYPSWSTDFPALNYEMICTRNPWDILRTGYRVNRLSSRQQAVHHMLAGRMVMIDPQRVQKYWKKFKMSSAWLTNAEPYFRSIGRIRPGAFNQTKGSDTIVVDYSNDDSTAVHSLHVPLGFLVTLYLQGEDKGTTGEVKTYSTWLYSYKNRQGCMANAVKVTGGAVSTGSIFHLGFQALPDGGCVVQETERRLKGNPKAKLVRSAWRVLPNMEIKKGKKVILDPCKFAGDRSIQFVDFVMTDQLWKDASNVNHRILEVTSAEQDEDFEDKLRWVHVLDEVSHLQYRFPYRLLSVVEMDPNSGAMKELNDNLKQLDAKCQGGLPLGQAFNVVSHEGVTSMPAQRGVLGKTETFEVVKGDKKDEMYIVPVSKKIDTYPLEVWIKGNHLKTTTMVVDFSNDSGVIFVDGLTITEAGNVKFNYESLADGNKETKFQYMAERKVLAPHVLFFTPGDEVMVDPYKVSANAKGIKFEHPAAWDKTLKSVRKAQRKLLTVTHAPTSKYVTVRTVDEKETFVLPKAFISRLLPPHRTS